METSPGVLPGIPGIPGDTAAMVVQEVFFLTIKVTYQKNKENHHSNKIYMFKTTIWLFLGKPKKITVFF